MRRNYQIPGAPKPITGLEKTFVFPQAANPPGLQPVRAQPPSPQPPILTAVAPQQTYVFPLSQPLNRRSYLVAPKLTVRSGTLPAPSSALILTYPVVYPDRTQRERAAEAYRYQRDVTPSIHLGAVPPTTITDPPWADTIIAGWTRRHYPTVPVTPPILGAPAAPADTAIYKITDPLPPQAYGYRSKPTIIVRHIRGTTPTQPIVPISLTQPTDSWWARIEAAGRALRGGVTPSVAGVTTQATYVFPLSQPERKAWYVPRAQPPSPTRLDGPPTLASYLFEITQPSRAAWYVDRLAPRVEPVKHTLGVFTPPAAPQTYVFEPNQPSRRFWFLSRTPSEQVPAPPIVDQGATALATDPIPGVSGPALAWWVPRWSVWDLLTRERISALWMLATGTITPVPVLTADACDTFQLSADPGFSTSGELAAFAVVDTDATFTVTTETDFEMPGC